MPLMETSLLRLYTTQQEELSTLKKRSEGTHANNAFLVPSDLGIMNWMSNTDSYYPWINIDDMIKAIDINNLQSVNGV